MKRLYYNIVYAICVIAGFSSCSDFLVIEPQNEIIFDKFWNEKADVDAVIAGCYSGLQEEEASEGEYRCQEFLHRLERFLFCHQPL